MIICSYFRKQQSQKLEIWMVQASVRIKIIAEKNGSTVELVEEVNETNINKKKIMLIK